MLKAELITDVAEIGPIEGEWRRLAEARSNAFLTPEWFRAWHRHHASQARPLIAVVRRADGSIAGVMPLVLERCRWSRVIRFAGAEMGDRFHPAAAPEEEAAVAGATVAALDRHGHGSRRLLLEHADRDVDWWRGMCGAGPGERSLIEGRGEVEQFIDLRGLDWEGYLSGRSRNFRKQMRRAERALERDHDLVVRGADAGSLGGDLDRLFRLHDLRLDDGGGSSLQPAERSSLRDFAAAALDRGWLRLTLMELDRQPAAAVLGWRCGSVFASYQGGFDPARSQLGIGFALEGMTVRAAIEEGAAEYGFLLGMEDWKARFSSHGRATQTAVLVHPRRPAWALAAGEAGARKLARRMRRRARARATTTVPGLLPFLPLLLNG